MAKKERIASWKLDGATLTLVNAQTKEEIKSLDLETVFPGFATRPVHEKFYLVYGLKQERSDAWSATPGLEKLKGIAGDLVAEDILKTDFSRAKGGGISYKAEVETLRKTVESILGAIMKLPVKIRLQTIETLEPAEQDLIQKIAAEKGIDLKK